VSGTGYTVSSDPFEVTAGPISVTASVAGRAVTIDAGYAAPAGWRLLDLEGNSNELVAIRRGPIDAVLVYDDGSSESFPDVALDAPGRAQVSARPAPPSRRCA
jgi:hypothetical protein